MLASTIDATDVSCYHQGTFRMATMILLGGSEMESWYL